MGHHHGAPLLYAGVGLGIFISAEGIALGHALSLTSQQIWLLSALCAGLLLALAIRWLLTPPAALVRVSHVETSPACVRERYPSRGVATLDGLRSGGLRLYHHRHLSAVVSVRFAAER